LVSNLNGRAALAHTRFTNILASYFTPLTRLYEFLGGKLTDKIYDLINVGWNLYSQKVSGLLLDPENEKMMQLQLASVFQTLAVLYESRATESIKVLLEVPVAVREHKKNIIDIVIQHIIGTVNHYYPIELKCFRKMTRDGKAPRG
jgi:hypothetical protein